MVKAGQVVAVMDTRDLQAELKQYQQVVLEDQRTLDQATVNYASQQAVVKFDQQEVARSTDLVPKGFATQETLDRQVQDLNSALARLCQLSSLLGATFLGCGASRLSSFQDTERDGCPAHMMKAPCSGGNVLAHARSRAEEVPEFVVTAAISSC